MVEDTLRRIVWVFPDRESQRGVRKWQATFWLEYAEVARELGLEWSAHAPDDVVVDCLDADLPFNPQTPEMVAARPGWGTTTAVRNQAIYSVDAALYSTPSTIKGAVVSIPW